MLTIRDGSKINRKYHDRNNILYENNFQFSKHIIKNKDGILVPSDKCPQQLIDDIMEYFKQRKEDE